ncbi:hypothetical protein [Nocardia sp. X0981]
MRGANELESVRARAPHPVVVVATEHQQGFADSRGFVTVDDDMRRACTLLLAPWVERRSREEN